MNRRLMRTAAAGALLGVSTYVGADVLGEYTTYCTLRDQGLAFANQDAALVAQVGTPFEDGPWYNASIGFTQSGHIAAITFPLKGSNQITDVTVRAVRRPGLPSTALYNLLGGEWKVLDCSAMAPQPGGLVRPRSIMPYQAVPKVQDGKVVAGEECEECNRKSASAGAGEMTGALPLQPAAAAAERDSPLAHTTTGTGGPLGENIGCGEATEPTKRRRKRFWVV